MEHGNIRHKNSLYTFVSIGKKKHSLSPRQQRHIEKLAASIKCSWGQVKMMEKEKLHRRTIQDMLNEL